MTTEFNLHNMNSAIIIMERAKIHNSLDMRYFQGDNDFGLSCTTDGLHACGNTACFAGHVAISPEFHATGGTVSEGIPEFGGSYYDVAIAKWLGIGDSLTHQLVYGDSRHIQHLSEKYWYGHSFYYAKPWAEVNADDVIAKLHEIKAQYLKENNHG